MSPESSKLKFHAAERMISFVELIDEILGYVKTDPNRHYSLMIGSDSRASDETEIITAVAIWKIGNGGRYFWTKSEVERCPTLRDRIYKEAMKSITLAQEIRSVLKDRVGEDFLWDNKISVHIDVGEVGPTKEFKESVLGMAKGFGFDAVIKPEAVAAFVVADRHT
ncbi:MAG: ribonuclease H-like YkuK family protein [Patescibacteria group bacterium]